MTEQQENNQPSFLDLLLEAHVGLERQGPGSRETVERALSFLGDLSRFESIADLGCGTGGQTLVLAEYLSGNIVGLDMFPKFVRELDKKALRSGLSERLKGVVGKMEELPFEKNSLDLIWSEGAIDNIGFEKGLSHWRAFLKEDGMIAVTCPSWLTSVHPEEAEKFWTDAGSKLDLIEDNIKIMQDCGYQFVVAFALTEDCWTKNYFEPREQAINELIEKYNNCNTVKEYAELNRCEAELYRKYKQHYGYVFYIGRNTDNSVYFKNYTKKDYNAVCDFLIELNRNDNSHINWNWARFEWMAEHPEFDKSATDSIGLWLDNERIVGAAIYDMYFGEAFCGAFPEYSDLYPEILDYAYRELKDENGLGVSICDDNTAQIKAAQALGFAKAEQAETVMSMELDSVLPVELPNGFRFASLDPSKEPYEFQWLLWQGFDHGTDRSAFEQAEEIIPQIRRHFQSSMSVATIDRNGEYAAYCCVWVHPKTDYAYVEPVCTVPSYRGKGVAKAVIYEALNRARLLGAKKAYVLSDMPFYEKLGFRKDRHFTFYWKG